jgi:hypothetical protein
MNISVNYDETDIGRLLSQIIVHPNAEEIVKLLTCQVVSSYPACNHLFKLHLGNKLYEPIPNGTLYYITYTYLSYAADIKGMNEAGLIKDGLVLVKVMHFRGYHENSNYTISFENIVNGKKEPGTSYCNHEHLRIIEEF